jgi:hypothetical protein
MRTLGRPLPSPSSHKRPPLQHTTSTLQRPPSPVKTLLSKNAVPSNLNFSPSLPTKTPSFPPRNDTAVRLPRKDENMLSVNGSPLANPYEFGLGWFKGIEAQMEEDLPDTQLPGQTAGVRSLKRSKSSIVIRRDPPVAYPANADASHSRTDSQLSFYTASSRTTSSTHSRENSQLSQLPAPPTTNLGAFRFPSSRPMNSSDSTPRPIHTRSYSALVAIPTKDGHVLEFDPLQTSPGSLDALEGISDSAKKHARVEMGKLIQATVDKWKIR